ncbi:MAG: type II secretion system F family protein [Candidatus Thermoplasmatota archaeon]|nr:type II secretion system F family protein [Candidatus Thermoplasmatota archaeon]
MDEPPEQPVKARKQMISQSRGGSGHSEIRRSADPEVRKKYIIYTIAIFFGTLFLALAIMDMPIGPFSHVKEEYKNDYPSNPNDQRMYMKEGVVPIGVTLNTTDLWVKDEVHIGWHSFFLLSFITCAGPISFYETRRMKKIDKIEDRLSDFLRDISESMRAGQTLHEAIKTSSGGDYGFLTPEIEKMAMQVSWGVSASKALSMFAERVSTPLVKRAVTLINEASSAGGNVSNVIDAAAKDTRELQIMKRTRTTEMSMYTYVIAIAFFVFIVVIAIMFATFVPRMEELSESYSSAGSSGGASPGGFDPTSVDFSQMKLLFFAAAAIQAVGDGIIGGIMSSGRVSNGLWLSTLFGVVTWLIFDLVLL